MNDDNIGHNYYSLNNDPHSTICYVKRRTDPLGGIKIFMDGTRGNPHCYPESRHVKKQPPPMGVLPGISIDLWNTFWDDMTKAEERGDTTMVVFILFGFSFVVMTMLFLLLTPKLNNLWHIVVPMLALLCICIVECRLKDTFSQWKQVINIYQPKFQQVGYNIALLIETSGQPGYKGIEPRAYVCHVWPVADIDKQQQQQQQQHM